MDTFNQSNMGFFLSLLVFISTILLFLKFPNILYPMILLQVILDQWGSFYISFRFKILHKMSLESLARHITLNPNLCSIVCKSLKPGHTPDWATTIN